MIDKIDVAKKHEQIRFPPRCDWCGEGKTFTTEVITLHPVIGASMLALCKACYEHDFTRNDGMRLALRKFEKVFT